MASNKKSKVTSSNLAVNRKATHDYIVLEKHEAGIELVGTEVKVLRNGEGGLMGAWCKADESNQLWLMQVRIPPYAFGNRFNHESLRTRRLLMHKAEIIRLRAKIEQKGLSLIPLRIYLSPRGKVKVEVALCQGKNQYDRRETIKQRDADRAAQRATRLYR
ncbi:MAG: SsrA-binding protein SmpB [Kiritimatiellae bacterium]|nr:SsrA-binding protein SmpB [Kiritimatiellia bacterium]MBR4945900.1 SsrA-binding protein SmpB [Kiritimatiellia bacterium]MBR5587984.1 SsrA-binding protein SmpB [Kiritimatiellia bacterium]